MYNKVFAKPQTLEQWRWSHLGNPVRRMDTQLGFCGEKLIAQSAGIPLVLSHDSRLVSASRIQNVLVDPDWRGRGVFTETLLRLTKHLEEQAVDFVLTFPNDNSLPGFLKTGLYTHVFDMAALQLDVSAGMPSGEMEAVRVESGSGFKQADVDFIAGQLKRQAIFTVRSLEYLKWRYHPASGHQYRTLRVFRGEEQAGFAVAKEYPPEGSVDLVEFIFGDDEAAVRGLLNALGSLFQKDRFKVLNVWSLEHYPAHKCLRRVGFTPAGRSTHVVFKTFSSRCSPRCADPAAYFLMMGDSDVY